MGRRQLVYTDADGALEAFASRAELSLSREEEHSCLSWIRAVHRAAGELAGWSRVSEKHKHPSSTTITTMIKIRRIIILLMIITATIYVVNCRSGEGLETYAYYGMAFHGSGMDKAATPESAACRLPHEITVR